MPCHVISDCVEHFLHGCLQRCVESQATIAGIFTFCRGLTGKARNWSSACHLLDIRLHFSDEGKSIKRSISQQTYVEPSIEGAFVWEYSGIRMNSGIYSGYSAPGSRIARMESRYSGIRIAPKQTLTCIIPIILIPDWSQTNAPLITCQ